MALSKVNWEMYPRRWIELQKTDSEKQERQFTIVTYNILCDLYIRDRYRYCPKEIRYHDSRTPRIMKEIKTMDPDILTLQEVSAQHYADNFKKCLEDLGYDMVVGTGGKYCVGQLTAWKKDKFRKLHYEEHFLADLATADIQKSELSDNGKVALRKWLEQRNLLLVTQLEQIATNTKLLIGNIHVTWTQFKRPYLQIMQTGVALRLLSKLATTLDTEAVIFCGDFNTTPDFIPYSFLMKGEITQEMNEYTKDRKSNEDTGEEINDFELHLENILPEAFKHTFSLASAYNVVTGHEPELTNSDDSDWDTFGKLCEGCLDYVLYNKHKLRALGALETPSRDVIARHTSLPSEEFPSDHLPLKFKLQFL